MEKEKKILEEKKYIEKRIIEIKREMQMHAQRRQQAQQVLSQETLQIAAKEGAIQELQNLLKSTKKK